MEKIKALRRYWTSARRFAGDVSREYFEPIFGHRTSDAAQPAALRVLPRWVRPVAVGIALGGAALGAGKVLLPFPHGAELSTGPRESKVGTFEDGSRIHVAPDSELFVSYGRRYRLIDARRGAFVLEVAKDKQDPARPFVVTTGYGEIRAVGTEFDVAYRLPGAVVVNVSEGKVRVTPRRGHRGEDPVYVKAGQRVTLSSDGTVTPATAGPVKREGEFFYFSGATVLEMVARFNLLNEKKIHLHDDRTEAAARLPVTVALKAHDPQAFVNFLMSDLGWEASAVTVDRPESIDVCTRPAASCPPQSSEREIARAH